MIMCEKWMSITLSQNMTEKIWNVNVIEIYELQNYVFFLYFKRIISGRMNPRR